MKTQSTRRAVMAGAAALPALSLPVLAVPARDIKGEWAKLDPEVKTLFQALIVPVGGFTMALCAEHSGCAWA